MTPRDPEQAALGFADQGYRGVNAPWRVILALILVIGGTILLVQLVAWIYTAFGLREALALLVFPARAGTPSLQVSLFAFAFLMFSVAVMLPLMRLILPWLHRRPWLSFITAKPRFDWRLFARSFGAMMGLALLSLGFSLATSPDALRWTADWHRVALFAPLALAFLPPQALAEEVLFRGYLAQLTGRVTRLWLIRLVLPALLFTAAHSANPEAQYDFLWASANYLLLAVYLGAISLLGGGLEASFGAHLAVNLNAALIVGSAVSVSPGPTLWLSGAPDFKASLVETMVLLALHYGLVFGVRRSPAQAGTRLKIR
jgi:membrane protease YdiL (CAAX protease family)